MYNEKLIVDFYGSSSKEETKEITKAVKTYLELLDSKVQEIQKKYTALEEEKTIGEKLWNSAVGSTVTLPHGYCYGKAKSVVVTDFATGPLFRGLQCEDVCYYQGKDCPCFGKSWEECPSCMSHGERPAVVFVEKYFLDLYDRFQLTYKDIEALHEARHQQRDAVMSSGVVLRAEYYADGDWDYCKKCYFHGLRDEEGFCQIPCAENDHQNFVVVNPE